MRIKNKLAVMTAGLVAALVAAMALLAAQAQKKSVEEQSARRLEAMMEGVSRLARESMDGRDDFMLLSYLLHLRQEHPELAYAEVVLRGRPARIGEDAPGLVRLERSVTPRRPVTYTVTASDASLAVSTAGVSLDARGDARVRVDGAAEAAKLTLAFRSEALEAEIRAALEPLLRRTLAVAGLFLVFGWAGAYATAALFTKPLTSLASAVAAMGAGDLEVRADARGGDEVASVAAAFNVNAARLRELLRFREDVLHTLTHELNTPLAALKGYMGLVRGEPKVLSTMEAALLRMETSLGGALGLFRAGAAFKPGRKRLIWVDELAAEVALLFEPLQRSKRLHVTLPAAPECLYADEDMLRHILTNLYSNALKYTPAGGEVRVDLAACDGELVLGVSDNGPGISADDLPHLFTKFYRAGGTRIPGTGLGLHIAQRAAEALGGRITAISAQGQVGTRFEARLPKAAAAQEAA